MKRRTLNPDWDDRAPKHHRSVYVVWLAPAASRLAAGGNRAMRTEFPRERGGADRPLN
jgi:hypothetical protein